MDNKIFDVNGRSKNQLIETLKLLLLDEYEKYRKVDGWSFSKEKGFILYWHCKEGGKANKFPVPLSPEALGEIIWEWLQTPEARSVELGDWEGDIDTDGSTERGFRVYTESWGHIKESEHTIDHYTLGAVKSVYCWYGK